MSEGSRLRDGEAQAVAAIRRMLPAGVAGGTDLRCARLAGGLAARSYLVVSHHGQWVVRLPHEIVVGEVLDAASEHAFTARAAAAGLAPPIAASDTDSGVLITEYLRDARPWSSADARSLANVRRLSRQLRKLHALPVRLPPFRAARAAERYIADRGDCGDEALTWAQELRRAARAFDARHAPSVPCHNDLAAANVLDDGRLWLVDFEYAVQGPPILDLANAAVMNDYDSRARNALLEAYFHDEPAAFVAADLDRAQRMLRLLWHFWGAAAARQAADPVPYAHFAESMALALRQSD